MPTEHEASDHVGAIKACAGDHIEARQIHGGASRRGTVIEIVGAPGRERYRVRWEGDHESIVFPADGVRLIPRER
jgi:hypothetical protein